MTRGKRSRRIPTPATHVFTLYVADIKPVSRRALTNIHAFGRDHLHGRYEVNVIDIAKHPATALADDVVVIPTLIKSWPLPRQMFVGDLSDTGVLLTRLAVGCP